tara:strand:- start:142 stop:636 length:495 start_codon:yes stop_codon:yes gene_type:complete
VKPKELGYVLSVDQASNCAGVSLWLDGTLQASTTLNSKSASDPFSRRIQFQLEQLNSFIDLHVPADVILDKVIFEGVRSRLVTCVVGAFLCCPRIDAKISEQKNFVESSSWKNWARARGAVGDFKIIKGVKALRECGWDMIKYPVTSDDIADSILMYLCWKDRP